MASSSDNFQLGTNNFSTTLSAAITSTTLSIPLTSVTNLPTATGITLVIDRINSTGGLTPSLTEYVAGAISSSDLVVASTAYRGLGGSTAQAHLSGAVVEAVWDQNQQNNLMNALLVSHTQTGALSTSALGQIYPVGSIYTSTTGTNPATLFGFGTWVAFGAGRVLVGVGTSDVTYAAGATGGASTTTLTTAQIPAHNHGVTDPGHNHPGPSGDEYLLNAGGSNVGYAAGSGGLAASSQTANAYTGVSTDDTGGGTAFNQMNPYIVVYFWNRTA